GRQLHTRSVARLPEAPPVLQETPDGPVQVGLGRLQRAGGGCVGVGRLGLAVGHGGATPGAEAGLTRSHPTTTPTPRHSLPFLAEQAEITPKVHIAARA